MDIKELNSFKLSDAVKFHDKLNPKLWRGDRLDPAVKKQLLLIAEDFIEELGIEALDVADITVSGSNAAFTYTPHSDFDLHILVDMSKLPSSEVYKELFHAKKMLYNDSHDISIHGVPIELYVQDVNEPVVSLGEYSILNDKWIKRPTKRRANLDQNLTREKFDKLKELVLLAIETRDLERVNKTLKTIRRYRQAGLDKGGEFSPENLAFKAIRKQGGIQKLYDLRDKLHSEMLTIENMYQIPESKKLDKPTMSVEELAKKHGVSRMDIASQLDKGIKVELEHTSDRKVAREIALDHLAEDPKYYDKLASVELESVDESTSSVKFTVRKGKNKFATELLVDGMPAGQYQYDANTGRSIAEVYPEYRNKGFGKLLVLHAIYTAAMLGLDFIEDESRTAEYDNILDSLSNNGYIINDEEYWYVTGAGEEYLKNAQREKTNKALKEARNTIKVYHGNQGGIDENKLYMPMWFSTDYDSVLEYTGGDGFILVAELTPKKTLVIDVKSGSDINSARDNWRQLLAQGYDSIMQDYGKMQDWVVLDGSIIHVDEKISIDEAVNMVNEADLKKNKWSLILSDADKDKWGEELIQLVNNAYMHTSLGSFVQDLYAVKGSEWSALDWDNDPDIDCTIFFRAPRSNETWKGYKVQGLGHDGNPESKQKVMDKLVASLSRNGVWIESSDALAKALAKKGAIPVTDEKLCKAIFPNTKLKMIDSNIGLYQREAGGRVIREIIYGKPVVSKELTESDSTENFFFDYDFDPKVKQFILSNQFNNPSLSCQTEVKRWAKKLHDAGLGVEIQHGFYLPNHKQDDAEGHTWLSVEGSIFDPTAGQFDDNGEGEYQVHETEDLYETVNQLDDVGFALAVMPSLLEASGYIPSKKEKNDPRFKTALTVDVKPDSIKKNAKAFNWKTSRAGIPPEAKANGLIESKIVESLDKPYPFEWENWVYGDYDAGVRLPDGTFLEIKIIETGNGVVQLGFGRNSRIDVTNQGDPFRIFATVLYAIKQYVEKYEPKEIGFSAEKLLALGDNTVPLKSRVKLYKRMIQVYAPKLGYVADMEDDPTGRWTDFTLRKTYTTAQVDESLDNPYPYDMKKHVNSPRDYRAIAELPDGTKLQIYFIKMFNGNVEVEFERDGNTNITNAGDAFRVFATVLAAIKEYIAKFNPLEISFSAEKTREVDGKNIYSASRAKLYKRLVQEFAPKLGYISIVDDAPYEDYVEFTLHRMKSKDSSQLDEALKPSQYRNIVKGWDKSRYAEIFSKYPDKDRNAYRIYLPLPVSKTPPKSNVVPEVEKHLATKGYKIKDYANGLATDGRREMRIGKLLSDTPEVAQKFVNDPARAATRQAQQMVVISRHPYDIAGMSTDRGWRSCMNLSDGAFSNYIPIDVKEGTIVAYLINANDRNIENPIARIAIKPFVNSLNPDEVIFGAENRVYGTSSPAFKSAVVKWVNQVNKARGLEGVFVFNRSLYSDSDNNPKVQFKDKQVAAQAKMIMKNPWSIKDIPNPTETLQLVAVNMNGNSIRHIENPTEKVQLAAVKKDGYAIRYIKDPSEEVQLAAMRENGYAIEFIKNPSEEVQLAAVRNYGYALGHINNPSKKVQIEALKKTGNALEFIDNPSEELQMIAVSKNGLAVRLIENPSEEVQLAAVTNDGTAIEYIKNPSEEVQLAAVRRDGGAIRFIKDPSEAVQLAAIKAHPFAIDHIKNPSEKIIQFARKRHDEIDARR